MLSVHCSSIELCRLCARNAKPSILYQVSVIVIELYHYTSFYLEQLLTTFLLLIFVKFVHGQ